MNLSRLSTHITPSDGDLKPIVEETLACIDAIHEAIDLPDLPVRYTDYVAPFGRYVPGDGCPDGIELSHRGPHLRLSLAHEVGHLLDHALGNYVVYCSQEPTSPLATVIATARNSVAIKMLDAVVTGSTKAEAGLNVRQIIYWLDPIEIWARAYAQYIALRSGKTEFSEDIRIAQSLQPFAVCRNVQWEEDDFASIATAIETVFRRWGWQQ